MASASTLAALAVTLIDGLYILLAGLGLAAVLQRANFKKIIRFGGAAVLIIFGLDITVSAFGLSFIPDVRLFQGEDGDGIFFKAAFMTASNPLTIVF